VVSLFDLFKIGLGPSSSHTVGPMRAAAAFVDRLAARGLVERTAHIGIDLYGSLALTGKGHGTDRAVLLGLEGLRPETTDPADADARIVAIRAEQALRLNGTQPVPFDEEHDLRWHVREALPRHPNALRLTAIAADGTELDAETYYSVGGGFVESESGERADAGIAIDVRYPYRSADELLAIARREQLAIWQVVLANERALREEATIRAYITRVWIVMQNCVERGLHTEGILPGGLNVRRRAPRLHRKLEESSGDPLATMDEVNVVAMAVNEENAAGGRVVTAPTNGAAGIIPAVAHHLTNHLTPPPDALFRYFLTATAIGGLYKRNASISGAEVGCQGEVGVACSMAAGALVAALNGTNAQVEYAAEIGMEHSLGMTCDPIGGLVQIPCIERNAVGAVRAIHAARMAMREDDEQHLVSLDNVIDVMYRTGLDMQTKYKETSLGGLAVGVIEC
jgi:L-serine dehydratase